MAEDPKERRQNFELRERLDEIFELARHLHRNRTELSEDEMIRARERLEWLAGEIFEAAIYGPIEKRDFVPPGSDA